MSFWGRIALVAAGALAGAAATRAVRPPGQDLAARGAAAPARSPRAGDWRSRLHRFAATVKAGMDEREAQLRQSFGVAGPGAPAAGLDARPNAPRVLDGTAARGAEPPAGPTDSSIDREGKHR